MSTIMSIAAGLAIGIFIYQYFFRKNGGQVHGRLHRSTRDKKIAGVCGGLAEFLGCDPSIIRIAWAALALCWGSGVLLYLICAFVLPEES